MNIKRFIKKRTVLVSSLVFLLMVVGYLNRQLTDDAMLKSSEGYKAYEKAEINKTINTENEKVLETSSKNIEIVENKKTDNTNNNGNYFVEHRLSRDKTRGETVDRLNKIIEDEKTKAETRDSAQNELIDIGDTSEMELFIEGIIKAKGFKDAVVFLNSDNARIVIDKEELLEQDVMKALEIVTSETELQAQNIKIMKKQ